MAAKSSIVARFAPRRLPILVRDQAEVDGVLKWMDAYGPIAAQVRKAIAVEQNAIHADEEYEEHMLLTQYGIITLTIGDLAERKLFAYLPFSKPDCTRALWKVQTIASALVNQFHPELCDNGAPEEIGREIRSILRAFDSTRHSEMDRIAAEKLLEESDLELGALSAPVPVDFLNDFLGLPDTEDFAAYSADLTPEILARMSAFIDRSQATVRESRATCKKCAGIVKAARTEVLRLVAEARSHLPGTGETHELARLIQFTEGVLLAVANREPVPDQTREEAVALVANGRLLPRMALWVELCELHWSPEARAVLRELILHPTRFARHDPHNPLGKAAKARLRPLRDYFVGFHPPHETASLLELLAKPTATNEQILWVLCEFIMLRPLSELTEKSSYITNLIENLLDAWRELLFAPAFHPAAYWLSLTPYNGSARLRTAMDVEFERLLQESTPPPSDSFDLPVFPAEEKQPAHTPAEPQIQAWEFIYVLNPESTHPRTASARSSSDDALDSIRALIEEHATTPEPAASLARAVHHFAFEVTETQRQTWNKEKIGQFTFHKLKRGRARIYVRVNGSTVHFHAYSRRDWQKGLLAE